MINISKDELIKTLILQDLKHCQLVYGLDQLHLDAGFRHFLGIMDLIRQLMDIPESEANQFYDTYSSYMQNCMNYPISSNGEELIPVAEECFLSLEKIQKNDFKTYPKQPILLTG